MLWINFLHIYQPANSDAYIIREATEKSYLRLIRALEEHPNLHFTFNISGCLFLRWKELGYHDIPERLKKLVERGQLEITGTAAYHALLPLVNIEEARKQIKENEKILKDNLGENFKPRGFFFPEMAYGPEPAKLIKDLGYEWTILDEISARGQVDGTDFKKVYQDENSGLKVIFRSRELSNSYVPKTIKEIIDENKTDFAITGTDGELYGLRYEDPDAIFEGLVKSEKLETKTVSEYINSNKQPESLALVSSHWNATEKDLKNHLPYSLWYDQDNKIQMKLWGLANFAYDLVEKNKDDQNYTWARWHLVRGFASCTFWWASAKDFRLFDSISWSPDEIERGSNELIRSIRALDSEDTREAKIEAEKLYISIKHKVWNKHWSYYWKK